MNMAKRKVIQHIAFMTIRIAVYINVGALLIFLAFITVQGISAISWEFLTQAPRQSMTEGGIWPCIVGTVYLSLGSILVAFPLGVGTAIYLNEYAGGGRWVSIVRMGIVNLAGVPSVVYGLFGLAFFVIWLGMGVSILAGSLTLGAFILPLIIGSSEEALRAVPQANREASLALGATQWQTISRVVLPEALPGMITGLILGISRAAGETAPIMFTAAVFYSRQMPTSIFDEVMAMPYHIYVLATAGTEIEKTRPLQYGTALTLMALVLAMNLLAIVIRNRLQKKRL
jgi:phosphate transport system permease protein